MEADDAALRAYSERGMERERLSDGRGDLEFTRTTEIVLRRPPAAPAVVADIGGGPGRYALWLASLGYQVEHLDLPDASVDAVLLLGPLYHLTDRAERVRAPAELREEIGEAALEAMDLVSVEGPALILGDLDARMADPVDRSIALEVSRAIERVPEPVGFGPHLLVTGIRL